MLSPVWRKREARGRGDEGLVRIGVLNLTDPADHSARRQNASIDNGPAVLVVNASGVVVERGC